MKTDEQFIQKYSLADIFDKTIKMLKYTWKDSILLSVIGFIPYGIAMAAALYVYFNAVINLATQIHSAGGMPAGTQWELLAPMFIALGLILAASLLYGIFSVFISGCVSSKAYARARGRQVSFRDNLGFILKQKLGKLLLQLLLFIVIYLGIGVAFTISLVIIGVILGLIVKSTAFVSAFMIVMFLALICVMIWLTISLSFSLQAVVLDDASPAGGLTQSFNLVKGNWWRVFGYNLLLGIVLSFAISLASFPIIMAFLLPVYLRAFESILNKSSSGSDLFPMLQAMKSLYIPLALSSFIQACGYMLIMPVFKTLFYIDLKYRKGGFDVVDEPSAPEKE
jgi:hypothetical protein